MNSQHVFSLAAHSIFYWSIFCSQTFLKHCLFEVLAKNDAYTLCRLCTSRWCIFWMLLLLLPKRLAESECDLKEHHVCINFILLLPSAGTSSVNTSELVLLSDINTHAYTASLCFIDDAGMQLNPHISPLILWVLDFCCILQQDLNHQTPTADWF